MIFHRFVITESLGGLNFWKGNNALTFAIYPQHSLDSLGPYQARVYPHDLGTMEEIDAWFAREGIEFILEDPARAVLYTVKKALLLFDWRFVPRSAQNALIDGETGAILRAGAPRPFYEDLLYSLPYVGALLLIALGFAQTWRSARDATVLVGLLFLAWTAAHAVIVAYTRYRMPLDPFLLIWAAHGFSRLASGIVARGRERRQAKAPVA